MTFTHITHFDLTWCVWFCLLWGSVNFSIGVSRLFCLVCELLMSSSSRFLLSSQQTPLRFYHKLHASCHYLGIKTPGEHFKRWKICRSAKLLIGAHACDLSTHTHTWDVFSSVYSQIGLNGRCWSMKTADRSVKPRWWEIGWMRSPRGCDAPLKARLQDPRSFNQPRIWDRSIPAIHSCLAPRLSSSC